MGLLLFTADAICMCILITILAPHQNERSSRDSVSLDYHAGDDNIRNHLSAHPTATRLGAHNWANRRHSDRNRNF